MGLPALLKTRGLSHRMGKAPRDPLDAAAALLEAGDATGAAPLLRTLDADPHACLGLGTATDDASVKKAYRSRALRFHPDKNAWDSTALFQALGWAFERLETVETRRAFAAEKAPPARVPTEAADRKAQQRKANAAKRAWQRAVGETLDVCAKNDRRSSEALATQGKARQRRLQSAEAARNRHADQASSRRTSDFAAHRRVLRERALRRGEAAPRQSFFEAKKAAAPPLEKRDPTRVVATFGKGPMGLELEAKTAPDGDEACVVASVAGAAAKLNVRKGDTLVKVNEDDVRGYAFAKCVAFVRKATESGGPRVLAFFRPRVRRAPATSVIV